MRFSVSILASAAALALVIGCSSSSTQDPQPNAPVQPAGGEGTPAPGSGTPAPDAVAGGRETNPDGVAYPSSDLGYSPRAGTKAGNRMPNYKFLGYVDADKGGGLKTVSLADYFDPEMKKYKIVHIIASSVWCGPCIEETRQTAKVKDALLAEKIVFIQALVDGPNQGTGATQRDLDGWIQQHGVNFTAMLDPNVKNLGQFFRAAAVPWNANIDARSMEILFAKEGAPPDISADVRRWATWVDSNPPKQ